MKKNWIKKQDSYLDFFKKNNPRLHKPGIVCDALLNCREIKNIFDASDAS